MEQTNNGAEDQDEQTTPAEHKHPYHLRHSKSVDKKMHQMEEAIAVFGYDFRKGEQDQKLFGFEARHLQDAFELFDKDSDGYLSKAELVPVLRILGQNPDKSVIDDIMYDYDVDKDNKLSYVEFSKLLKRYLKDPREERIALRKAFDYFDKDNSGKINIKEMKKALTQLGDPLTEAEAEELIRIGDTNNDGDIDFNEFTEMLCRCKLKET